MTSLEELQRSRSEEYHIKMPERDSMSQVMLWSTPAIPGAGEVNGIVLRTTARDLA